MSDHRIEAAETCKRVAEQAARIVLAKHPCVVPGSVSPKDRAVPPSAGPVDVGTRNVGQGLSLGNPSGFRRS